MRCACARAARHVACHVGRWGGSPGAAATSAHGRTQASGDLSCGLGARHLFADAPGASTVSRLPGSERRQTQRPVRRGALLDCPGAGVGLPDARLPQASAVKAFRWSRRGVFVATVDARRAMRRGRSSRLRGSHRSKTEGMFLGYLRARLAS